MVMYCESFVKKGMKEVVLGSAHRVTHGVEQHAQSFDVRVYTWRTRYDILLLMDSSLRERTRMLFTLSVPQVM